MSIYKTWLEQANQEFTQEEYDAYWKTYFLKEQKNYETIIGTKNNVLAGTVVSLAETFEMSTVEFSGFLDGINTSLETEVDLDELTEETELNASIVWEKLYYNMLNAKADWLYNIEAWDNILTVEERKEIKKQFNKDNIIVNDNKIGRNDPCPCGSGKKFKKCCINK